MSDNYDYHRAEVELKRAQAATDPAAIRAHYELANRYLDRFYNPQPTDRREDADWRR